MSLDLLELKFFKKLHFHIPVSRNRSQQKCPKRMSTVIQSFKGSYVLDVLILKLFKCF